MIKQIILNTTPINVESFSHTTVPTKESHDILRVIKIDFKVTSDMYHEMTTLLYKNDFDIIIPGKNIEFHGHILNYSTSITNLYKDGEVGMFHVELIETKGD